MKRPYLTPFEWFVFIAYGGYGTYAVIEHIINVLR